MPSENPASKQPSSRPVGPTRSPNYPQLSVAQSLDRVSKIYDKEHTHIIPAEVAAAALGYTSLNGTSKSILSALRKYGLLDSSGEGYRVSDDAVTIIELPSEDPQRIEAIRRSALRPSVFQMLHDKYGITLPSDGTLRHFLVQNSYQSDGANQVIKVYKETLDYLNSLEGEKISQSESVKKASVRTEADTHQSSLPRPGDSFDQKSKFVSPSEESHTGHLRFRISQECDAEIRFTGSVSQQGIDKLIQYLELSKDIYPDTKETSEQRNFQGVKPHTKPQADILDEDLDDFESQSEED